MAEDLLSAFVHTAAKKRTPSPVKDDERELLCLLEGLLADGEVIPSEIEYLRRWLKVHALAKNDWAVDALYCRIERMLDDGMIDVQEQKEIIEIVRRAHDPVPCAPRECLPIGVPYDDPAPELLPAQRFCLTGKFRAGKREYCKQIIKSFGGTYRNCISGEECVLVVGSLGWSDSFSSKLQEAIARRAGSARVSIVSEEHWWKVFGKHFRVQSKGA